MDGHCQKLTLTSVEVDEDNTIPYNDVRVKNGLPAYLAKYILTNQDQKRLSSISITADQLQDQAQRINLEIFQALLYPPATSKLSSEFTKLNERLGHILFSVIFKNF